MPTRMDGWTPAHYAAASENPEVIRTMVEGGTNFDIPNNEGQTPADIIMESKNSKLVNALRNRNLRTNEPNDDGPDMAEPTPHQSREESEDDRSDR